MPHYPPLTLQIAGESLGIEHRKSFTVRNPATGEALAELPLADTADLDRALETAQRGFRHWRHASAQQRADVLEGAARLMLERREELAWIATQEQGKTLAEARVEVMMNVGLFRFYAGEVHRLYGRQLVRPTGFRSTVVHEPVGPVAAFAPWNFPLGNPGRKLGAPIAAGCSVILKAAEETPASALGVLQCLYDAGLPRDVAQAVFGDPAQVSSYLLASPVIRKLSFTGSTVVGKLLMKQAADDLKRTTMELGGHGPVLVFNDVDLERVLDTVVPHKFRNAGQVCVAPTRFIVEDGIYDRFVVGFAQRAKALKVGPGWEEGVQMGPMANERRPEAIEKLVADAVARGARLMAGGERIGNQGYFFAPTVLADTPLDAEIMNEEPFGPVALVNRYAGEEAMIAEANRLPFGLAAYAWTQDYQRHRRLAAGLETGMLAINTTTIGASDAPFGGVKWSGHGHEDGPEGLQACLVTKTIHEG